MQGLSLADLVAARTPAITAALQSANPILQALQARKQNAQRQAMIWEAAGHDPQKAAMYAIGVTPPEARAKPRTLLSSEVSKMLADKLKFQLPPSGQIYEDEIPALKTAQGPSSAFSAMSPDAKEQIAKDLADGKIFGTNLQEIAGRGSAKDRGDIYLRAKQLNKNLNLAQGDIEYLSGRAGGQASAKYTAGGRGQESARAAMTVKNLTKGLQRASDNYTRAGVRFLNIPLNEINTQTGNDAMRFKQYLIDTRSKMATALQNGGIPQNEAREQIEKAFPDTMTAAQIPEAIKTVNEIMDTQIEGALTPVSLPVKSKGNHDALLDKYGTP